MSGVFESGSAPAEERPDAREVRRAWCLLSDVDPDELEREIDRRAAEMRVVIGVNFRMESEEI